MKHFEIEQKYRIKDPSKIRVLLRRLCARKIHSGNEYNELYDFNGQLRANRSILRLRQWGKKALLTFKGPRLKSKYKKRVEIETVVNFKSTRFLLQQLGFRLIARYRKKREEFRLGPAAVTLDYLSKVGWFVEIEGRPKNIEVAARKLGLSNKDVEPRSYLQILYPSWRQAG